MTGDKLKKPGTGVTIHNTVTGYDFRVDEKLRPLKAIRLKCLECNGTSPKVKDCEIFDCTLWPYRSGRRPGDKRSSMSAEKRAEVGARFRQKVDAAAIKLGVRPLVIYRDGLG